MAAKKQKKGVSELGFEEAIKQLSGIVARIERGEIALQDSLRQYERGMELIKHCREVLASAEKRIEKISEPQTKPKKSADS